MDFEEGTFLLKNNYVEDEMKNGAPGDIGVFYNKAGELPLHGGDVC
jgi:hypothetical protein